MLTLLVQSWLLLTLALLGLLVLVVTLQATGRVLRRYRLAVRALRTREPAVST